MPKVKLTARTVENLRTNGDARVDYWDTTMPGLILRVGRTSKTWIVRYRVNGTHRRHKLGIFPRLGLADAREAARAVLVRADAGDDPAAEKQERRSGDRTFRALADEVLEARKAKTRERTHTGRLRQLERDILPLWGDRDASGITRREVVQLVEKIAKRAPINANRALGLIRLIYNDGLRRGFPGLEANPAHMVQPPAAERARERYLSAKELKKVWAATEREPLHVRAAVRLAFLTAQRIGSILAMRWDEIDGGLWTISADNFKGKRTHLVPLAPEARALLKQLGDPVRVGPYVFPSRTGTKAGHLTNFGKPLARVRKTARIPHWTMHDARRTFRTWATRAKEDGGLGIAPHVADAVLGHAENTLGFSRYTGDRERYLLAEKRAALAAWGEWVRKAVA